MRHWRLLNLFTGEDEDAGSKGWILHNGLEHGISPTAPFPLVVWMVSRKLLVCRVDQTVVVNQQGVTLVQNGREELCNRMFACTRTDVDPNEGLCELGF